MLATPSEYELSKCEGIITEQILRPTGLLDPIEVRKTKTKLMILLMRFKQN